MIMANSGEVTIERGDRHYGATYTVTNNMLQIKTHTETRSVELDGQDPEALVRRVLFEIVDAQPSR
jgi:hypothetical protein